MPPTLSHWLCKFSRQPQSSAGVILPRRRRRRCFDFREVKKGVANPENYLRIIWGCEHLPKTLGKMNVDRARSAFHNADDGAAGAPNGAPEIVMGRLLRRGLPGASPPRGCWPVLPAGRGRARGQNSNGRGGYPDRRDQREEQERDDQQRAKHGAHPGRRGNEVHEPARPSSGCVKVRMRPGKWLPGDRHQEGKQDRHQKGKRRSTTPACGNDSAARGKGCSR
jgi:hypothetical protein